MVECSNQPLKCRKQSPLLKKIATQFLRDVAQISEMLFLIITLSEIYCEDETMLRQPAALRQARKPRWGLFLLVFGF